MTTHSMRAILIFAVSGLIGMSAFSQSTKKDPARTLVKFKNSVENSRTYTWMTKKSGWEVSKLTDQWVLVKGADVEAVQNRLSSMMAAGENEIEYSQPDYAIRLMHDWRVQDPLRRAAIQRSSKALARFAKAMPADNPEFPTDLSTGSGADPDFGKQWGMHNAEVPEAWRKNKDARNVIVAVIDTGVDYTHEDLRPNLWINKKEIPGNGIDDDGNGYIDDVLGWDFAANDNKPFDLAMEPLKVITTGGNPGHGTHCAGNVGARGDNGLGIAGVAPHVQIMSLRFISEKGAGYTSGAIGAIKYAVDNGAKVLSNSWGSEGEDPNAGEENKALRDVITYAEQQGVLFVAAAGNGHRGKGYDNDNDPAPAYPASYPHSNIITVTAMDVNDRLGSFANWGNVSVDIGAPGLNVYSTMVGNIYSDKVVDLASISVDWDGTSMAAPHVAGAAALYWGANPTKSWQDVKDAVLKSATPVPALKGKILTGGKLNVNEMMKR